MTFPHQIHLFDIDIPGKITFEESEDFIPGDKLTIFKTRETKDLNVTSLFIYLLIYLFCHIII